MRMRATVYGKCSLHARLILMLTLPSGGASCRTVYPGGPTAAQYTPLITVDALAPGSHRSFARIVASLIDHQQRPTLSASFSLRPAMIFS